jgi:hypothetical protein
VDTICPKCDFCADCDDPIPHCRNCKWGRDCLKSDGIDWCVECNNCEDCCICSAGTCAACDEPSLTLCPDCRWCNNCDPFERCHGCRTGRDCIEGGGGSWCEVCENCGDCCDCPPPEISCTSCKVLRGDICVNCGFCAACDAPVPHCHGCGWGRDCLAGINIPWCTFCKNCEECCSCPPLVPVYRNGDVNGDGAVTITDALEVLMFLAGLDSVIPEPLGSPSAPTINDALEILMHLAGMRTSIPK